MTDELYELAGLLLDAYYDATETEPHSSVTLRHVGLAQALIDIADNLQADQPRGEK